MQDQSQPGGDDPILAMIPLGDYQTNAFVVADDVEAGRCWIIDCGDRPEPLVEAIERSGRTPAGIVLTHCHHDHIAGIDRVLGRFGPMPIRCHHLESAWNQEPMLNLSALLGMPSTATPPDECFEEGDECLLGAGWRILHLPGHSPGSSAFLHEGSRTLVAGDTLFAGSMGRVDFPTSDPEAMRTSLRRLLELPDDVRVLPGHGPGTTIGQERASNPFLRA
ncbi:MAG: MBL fold metallo-hydrolase [Planctomycetota bacterium]|nr:MBL fold metallo-hydrolase [Planctomycetota bacterium]